MLPARRGRFNIFDVFRQPKAGRGCNQIPVVTSEQILRHEKPAKSVMRSADFEAKTSLKRNLKRPKLALIAVWARQMTSSQPWTMNSAAPDTSILFRQQTSRKFVAILNLCNWKINFHPRQASSTTQTANCFSPPLPCPLIALTLFSEVFFKYARRGASLPARTRFTFFAALDGARRKHFRLLLRFFNCVEFHSRSAV